MDQIAATLLNYGIGGAMALAVLWFLYHLVSKVIPDLVAKHQAQMIETRADFKESLIRIEEKWQKAVEAICARLESLERKGRS